MTGSALCVAVISEQREPGKRVVKEHVFGPRMLVVAVFADRSLGALVRVVVHMTQTAGCRWLSVKRGFKVTTCTFSIGVRATKGVSGVDVVIERDLHPLSGDVAGVTLLAKVPVVIVDVVVTRETRCGQLVSERVIAMTIIASEHCVSAR